MTHSVFLDYYGIELNSHSASPPLNGYSTRPVIAKKNFNSILSLPNDITFLPNSSFFTFLQLFHRNFSIILPLLLTAISPSFYRCFTANILLLLHLHLIRSFFPSQPSPGSDSNNFNFSFFYFSDMGLSMCFIL